MKRILTLLFAVGISCSVTDNTSDTQIQRSIPATFYLQPSPHMYGKDQIVVLSAATADIGIVHTDPVYRRTRYRQILNGVVVFNQGQVYLESVQDTIIHYSEVKRPIRKVTIDKIQYPYVWLDGERFSYEGFILDYRASPPYQAGDELWVLTEGEDLLAIQ